MTGHHIYTRSWYEYGSRSKNPGTFTVELTEGLFEPDTSDVIYHKLNPVLAGTQPSIAGYDLEHSLLRVFHPTPDSTIVSRSYFVNDEITKRGVVQYSFGLVFSKEANDRFLRFPKRAFERDAIEPYDVFVRRVSEENPLEYSAAFDPRPVDYQQPLIVSRNAWSDMGFDENIFTMFFVSLGKAITSPKGEQRVAVLLPEGKTGEELILAVLTILPPWLLNKFGAISRWTGSLESGSAASLGGMQLAFYSGEKPPNDTVSAIIDLTGGSRHKNIEEISIEQAELAKWYWENIDKPDAVKLMVDYMNDKYKHLMGKMPFSVFAHCFYLWASFHVNNYNTDLLTFDMAARAINSLVSAFGKNLEKFFTNKLMLASIFRVFSEQLGTTSPAQISVDTVRSICILANNDFKVGDLQAQDLIQPLASLLFAYSNWGKLEAIMQYYAKLLKDGASEEMVSQALRLYELVLSSDDKKSADDAAAVLSNYANASVAAMLKEGVNRVDEYKKIALMLKGANRQMGLDIASWENVSRNEKASHAFFLLEKFNREQIANINPPNAKQLDNIINGIKNLQPSGTSNYFQTLLSLYWKSDALNDTEQMRKYVQYLRENNKLRLYLQNNVGTDDIRDIFIAEVDRTLDTREFLSEDEKIDEILKWFTLLRNECGFPDTDPIFLRVGAKLTNLGGIDTICKTIAPKTIKTLAEIFKNLGAEDTEILYEIIKFDEQAGLKSPLSRIYGSWGIDYHFFTLRVEYWFDTEVKITPEWALSRAVFEAAHDRQGIRGPVIADSYLSYRSEMRSHKDDLINLYEAVHFVDDGHYDRVLSEEVFVSLRGKIFQIITELESRNSYEQLFASATKFNMFAGRLVGSVYMPQLGRIIAGRIKSTLPSGDLPYEILQKFNPGERMPRSSRESFAAADLLCVGMVVLLFAGVLACLLLLLSGGIGLPPAILALPAPLLIALLVSLLVTFFLTLLQIFRPGY